MIERHVYDVIDRGFMAMLIDEKKIGEMSIIENRKPIYTSLLACLH